MIQFQSKIDAALLSELKILVAREREVTTDILHYLREVETRKLHLERGYPSLFEFASRELGYSAGAAHRRIAAMRLLKSLPDLESKIQSGELSLSVAAQAQGFFRDEGKRRKVSTEEKRATVESLLGLSTRECERKLAAISPEAALPKERERVVTENLTQIQFLADRELLEKLEKLKGLLAHRNFEGSYAVLFHRLADLALKKLLPAQNESERQSRTAASSENLKPSAVKKARFIPAAVKRAVYARDGGKCAFEDPKTKRRCGSAHANEYDHRAPFCLGGGSTVENVRLLCSRHHRLETEKLALLV